MNIEKSLNKTIPMFLTNKISYFYYIQTNNVVLLKVFIDFGFEESSESFKR